METKTGAAKVLLLMGMGLIGLGLFHGGNRAHGEEITAEQLTQLAAALEGLTSCHLQCVNDANAEKLVLLGPAVDVCADLKPPDTEPGLPPNLTGSNDYLNCLRDNTDATAASAIDREELRCRTACLVTVMDPDGQGVTALAPSELDRDEIQLCHINCYMGEANYNVYQNCIDTHDGTSASSRYCDALTGAHKNLCGRSCTDPAKFPDAQTVTVTHQGVSSEAYAQCVQDCDPANSSALTDCITAYRTGIYTCPEDDSWVAGLCQRNYLGLGQGSLTCHLLGLAGTHRCRFKCMSEHGATQ